MRKMSWITVWARTRWPKALPADRLDRIISRVNIHSRNLMRALTVFYRKTHQMMSLSMPHPLQAAMLVKANFIGPGQLLTLDEVALENPSFTTTIVTIWILLAQQTLISKCTFRKSISGTLVTWKKMIPSGIQILVSPISHAKCLKNLKLHSKKDSTRS